ncbi:hypothetical protein JAAARDRAFT_217762 [Jaapia argillacea MUCL 33604]|uniref:F-box domain-containing protein n=1 Tax=Jaapia argillacea MUCL 33604 TaxID=933084 RepID=A0A067QKV5_9AGAM|nr:hypothetical protein JAAARDRAFT_217762 [Jaapia argillacea MUCL 33604]
MLGSLVWSIVVWNVPITPQRLWPFASKKPAYRRAQEDFPIIMQACPNVTALGIVCNPSSRFFSAHTCLQGLTMLAHLRQLEICCGRDPKFMSVSFFPANIDFPVLEELSLECLASGGDFGWPRLLTLTHLRLRCSEAFYGASLIPKGLSSLRSIELFDVGTYLGAENQIEGLYEYADVLESLAVALGCWATTPAILDVSRFKVLKHLVLDFLALVVLPPNHFDSAVQPRLSLHPLPPTLQTLNFLDLVATVETLNRLHPRSTHLLYRELSRMR